MAKAASSSPKKSAAKGASHRQPAADDNFELRSLQDSLDRNRRFKASKDELLALYEQMLLIRRFEEKAGQLYGLGLIGGFCHLYIGQEAVAVGLLDPRAVDPDLSTELLRRDLNVAHPDEYILDLSER